MAFAHPWATVPLGIASEKNCPVAPGPWVWIEWQDPFMSRISFPFTFIATRSPKLPGYVSTLIFSFWFWVFPNLTSSQLPKCFQCAPKNSLAPLYLHSLPLLWLSEIEISPEDTAVLLSRSHLLFSPVTHLRECIRTRHPILASHCLSSIILQKREAPHNSCFCCCCWVPTHLSSHVAKG